MDRALLVGVFLDFGRCKTVVKKWSHPQITKSEKQKVSKI